MTGPLEMRTGSYRIEPEEYFANSLTNQAKWHSHMGENPLDVVIRIWLAKAYDFTL